MPARAAASYRSHRLARAAGLLAGVVLLLVGIWSVSGPEAQGSNVLIVIEDASSNPTGLFPGTVCYQLTRQSDEVVITEGCLAFAASIAEPAGFDHGVLYTLAVSINNSNCTLLPDQRIGSGVVPFRVRVSCNDPDGDRSFDSSPAVDAGFSAASASPIAIPERRDP